MCLLTYLPAGIHPDVKALARGAKINDDGHGFAIVIPRYGKHGRILVRKSMDPVGLIKEFQILRQLYPDGPALFHSRITTDGVTNLFNCHPFMSGGDKRTVIGHNGILPRSVRPSKGDPRSDTRIFAQDVAGRFQLHTELGRDLAGEWMGSYNKIVILSVDPAFDEYGYIVNESEGVWEDGIWYSNTSFRGYRTYGYTVGHASWSATGNGWTSDVGDWEWCAAKNCTAQAATVNPYSLICTRCRCCSICLAQPCECYLGEFEGKGENRASVAKGALLAAGQAVVLGPKSTTTSDASISETDVDETVAEYWEARQALDAAEQAGAGVQVAGYDYDGEDDHGDDVISQAQFQQVLALVGVMNAGGEIDPDDGNWPEPDGVYMEPDSGEDYLVHNGTRYAVE